MYSSSCPATAVAAFISSDLAGQALGQSSCELLAQLQARKKTGIDLSARQLALARARLPEATFVQQAGEALDLTGPFDYIIVSDTLNFAADAQELLARARTVASPHTRLVLNVHNTLWRPVFALARWLGLRRRQPEGSWMSKDDVANLLALTDWEVIKTQSRLLWPVATPLLAALLNRWIAPLLPPLCLSIFTVARPCNVGTSMSAPSVAWMKLTGTSQSKSSPSREKISCCLTCRKT